jgi:hypothetical protein
MVVQYGHLDGSPTTAGATASAAPAAKTAKTSTTTAA